MPFLPIPPPHPSYKGHMDKTKGEGGEGGGRRQQISKQADLFDTV